MTENGDHYKNELITSDMVGKPLDPAMFEKVHPMPMMLGQAFKKIVFAGKRGKKNRIQDLKDAIGAIEREIELSCDVTVDLASKWPIGVRCKLISLDSNNTVVNCFGDGKFGEFPIETYTVSELKEFGWHELVNLETGEKIKL